VIPNLGVCEASETGGDDTFVIADIPGLLEGAHDGVGLGRAFLRHVERCRLLVHVVDGSSADPLGDFEAVATELRLFSPWLARKPSVVVLNKRDIPSVREDEDRLLADLQAAAGHKRVLSISAATRDNCDVLMQRLRKLVASAKLLPDPPMPAEEAVDLDAEIRGAGGCEVIAVADGEWRLTGARIEKAAAMTNWDYYESQTRFQRIMHALGAAEQLREAGAKSGDIIMVGKVDFSYFEESTMAARARLAGFNDERRIASGNLLDEDEDEAAARDRKAIDKELKQLLDSVGDVVEF
jgi:GTP-binding protein